MLEQEGALEIWDDRRIVAGEDWRPKIETAMARARAAVLLVSADFLTSAFIRGREVPELLRRRETAGLPLIPVIVRPCPWQAVPWLEKIQCWPKGVTDLASLTEADAEKHLSSLAFAIRDLIKAPPPRAPVLPQMPPPIPQPLPAPRRLRIKFLLGIGCGAVLAILELASLGNRLSKQNAEILSTAGPPAATTPAAEIAPAAVTFGGRFANVWFEPNVQQDGRSGMLIHAAFTVEGARQQSCEAAAYFYDSTGQILKDFNQAYRAPDGQVAVAQGFTPPDEQADYEDFTLFMPYDELHMTHMAPGSFNLKFQMVLYHLPTESVIVKSELVDFMIVAL